MDGDIVRSYAKAYGFAGKAAATCYECCELMDEMEFECEAPIAEEVSKMIEKSIEKAGQLLKLSVPLAGEGKTGPSWRETH